MNNKQGAWGRKEDIVLNRNVMLVSKGKGARCPKSSNRFPTVGEGKGGRSGRKWVKKKKRFTQKGQPFRAGIVCSFGLIDRFAYRHQGDEKRKRKKGGKLGKEGGKKRSP